MEIEQIVKNASGRLELWTNFLNARQIKVMAEVGVFRGDFAEKVLGSCNAIEKYYMVDPWRNLSDWNKPANRTDDAFEAFYEETLHKTDFAREKRIILRGKTTEVVDQIREESLDFAYIDGDHTLKGISIDLINMWSKIRENGFIGGDDFSPSIWQHKPSYEPTLVFPFAVYFAEAVGAKIYGLPYGQFLMEKTRAGFDFTDLTGGKYKDRSLLHQLNQKNTIKSKLSTFFPAAYRLYKKI